MLTLLFLQSLVLALLSGFGIITTTPFAALALFAGVANSFETPTRQAFFVQLLDDRADLANAIALNSILMNGARLVGPSIGGFIIAAWDETTCFAINAASYLPALAALAGTKQVRATPPRAASHPLADLADGWRYAVITFIPIRRMLFLLATVSIAIGPHPPHAGDRGEDLRAGAAAAGSSSARSAWARSSPRALSRAAPVGAGPGEVDRHRLDPGRRRRGGFCFSRSVPRHMQSNQRQGIHARPDVLHAQTGDGAALIGL